MSLAHDLAGTLAVNAYQRAAQALHVGLSVCADEGRPLSELQTIDLTWTLIQAMDGLRHELECHLAIDASLHLAGPRVFGLDLDEEPAA